MQGVGKQKNLIVMELPHGLTISMHLSTRQLKDQNVAQRYYFFSKIRN